MTDQTDSPPPRHFSTDGAPEGGRPQPVHPVDLHSRTDSQLLDDLITFEQTAAEAAADRAAVLVELAGRARTRATETVGTNAVAGSTTGSSLRLAAFGVAKREELERRSMIAEIACALRMPESTIHRYVNDAEALVFELPETLAALRAGQIWYRHAQVMVSQAGSLPPDARGGFESSALPGALSSTAPKFDAGARKLREAMHPDSIEVRAVAAREARYVQLEADHDGMSYLHAYLPTVDAHRIDDALNWYATQLHADGDNRTKPQLRADALIDVIVRTGVELPEIADGGSSPNAAASDKPAPASRPVRPAHPTVIVTVPISTLLGTTDQPGELAGYGPIDAAAARGLAANAPSLLRMITDAQTGEMLSLGRRRYRPPRHLQLALQLDDQTCRFPGCNRRASGCEVDHTIDWADGGETNPDNLAHLCPKHHHLKHETDWSVEQQPDRQLKWRSPNGRQYSTGPARAAQLLHPPF